eukprot:403360712
MSIKQENKVINAQSCYLTTPIPSTALNAVTSYSIIYQPLAFTNMNTMRITFQTSLYTISACSITSTATLSTCTTTASSGYVTLTPSIKTSGTSYTIAVTVKNPYAVQTISGITCSVLNSASSAIETVTFNTGSTGFALVQGAITSSTLSSSSSANGATATWTLTSTLTNGITTRGRVKLTFQTHTYKYIGYGETTGKIIQQIINILARFESLGCTEDTGHNLQSQFRCDYQITLNNDNTEINIQVYPSSNLAASSSLQIVMTLCKNPISQRPYTGVTINTLDYIYPIDRQLTGISLTTTSSSQTGKQAFIYNDKVLIGETGADYFFQFTTVNPIPKNAYLVIEVPVAISTFTNIGSWVFTMFDETLSGVTYSKSSQTITVSGMFSDYLAGGTDLYFRIKGWTNPSTTTAANFIIKTYESLSGTAYLIDTFSGLQIQASLGVAYILRAEPVGNTQILAYPSNNMYIFFKHKKNNNEITIPQYYQQHEHLRIYNCEYRKKPWAFECDCTISTFSITPISYMAGQKSVNYTFSVKPAGWISLGAYLQITLASDISLYNIEAIEFNCGGTLTGFSSSRVYCSVRDDSKILIQKGFQASKSSSDPPTLQFTIPYLNNPRSLAPSKVFGVRIYDSQNRMIYLWESTTSPTVQMKTTGKPTAFSLSRRSTQNSAVTDFQFSITPNLYFEAGDLIRIVAPTPIIFSSLSTCTGIQALASSLTCTVSSDKSTVDIKVAISKRNLQTSITSGTVIIVQVSNISNPQTSRQTASGFQYYATTASGYTIESLTTGGPTIKNTLPGSISPLLASVIPSNYIQSSVATYTFQFVPTGFEQNMKIKVSIPKEVTINGTSVVCRGIYGTDNRNLTYSITSNLDINFFCTYPCRTCLTENPASCQSCYGFVTEKSFYVDKCYEVCPSGYYTDSSNNCTQCESPCKECSQDNGLCLSCIDKYDLYDDGKCYQKVIIAQLYPFPFSVAAIALTVSVLVSLCFAKNTKFLQSVIAMLAIPEIGAWGTAVYMMFMSSDDYHLDYYERHLKCNRCSNIFSLILSFKFNVIQISVCGGGDHLKGHWNRKQWCIWNLIVVGYLITSCALMIFALVLQILSTNSQEIRTFTWYITCDTLFVTIYMAILLFLMTLRYLPCCKIPERINDAQPYNKVVDNSNSVMDDSLSESQKRLKKLKVNDLEKSKQETEEGPRTRRKETDIPNGATQQEIELLEKFMEKLKLNGGIIDPKEKLQMMEARKKIIQENKDPSKRKDSSEIETLREELRQNKQDLDFERQKLDDLKRDFLDEVDKRVSKRLEDWELSSQISRRQSKVIDPMDGNHAFDTLRATPNKIMMNSQPIRHEDELEQTQNPPNFTPTALPPSPIKQMRKYKAVHEKLNDVIESRVLQESQFEPITQNNAVFEKVNADEREITQQTVMMGRSNSAVMDEIYYSAELDDQKDTDDDLDEIKMDETEQRPPRPSSPIVNDVDEERDQVDDNVMKKNVLYSDKSESSIDEMMEDTPSNYNIPNGRLDGKSIGLKALLLQAKKQGIKLDISQNSDGTALYNNNNNTQSLGSARALGSNQQSQSQLKIISPQNVITKAPRNKEEEEKKFINNIFRGSKEETQNMQNQSLLNNNNSLSYRQQQQDINNSNPLSGGDQDNYESIDIEEQKSARKQKKKVFTSNKQFKEPSNDDQEQLPGSGRALNRDISQKSNKFLNNNTSAQRSPNPGQDNGMSKIKSNNFV